ncbi:MAG: CDP-diacylglycerol--glycerol-3-phosphate 3-phosphatidyltransferase [Candidatus Omnitrophica bacterium]|nr:CDP-diacylglycerol--glycerol-3-phosphate 3-phosphatidyltransferase [Candidatus Omnitrophota bacterium]
MNIANKLTIGRIFLSFICIGFILGNNLICFLIAFLIFILASITDFLDGYLARKLNLVSDLGKLLDPVADKILMIGVFLAFLQLQVINAWMVSVIMLREFVITSLRLYSLNRGIILEARRCGKHKTVSQIVAVVFIFIVLILQEIFHNDLVYFFYSKVIPFIMLYVVGITLFSGIYYLWVNRKTIRTF